jgi:hypothetical protein
MGGRERRGGRVRSRLANAAIPSVVATLEERTTAVSKSESEERLEAREGPCQRGNNRLCSLVYLFSKTGLEEPFAAAEGTYKEARSGAHGGPPLRGGFANMYTSHFVQQTGFGGAVECDRRISTGLDRDPKEDAY